MNYHIARSQPSSPVGTGCAFIHQVAILAGEGDIERTPRRTRGFVHPNHLLLATRQITAKRRLFLLAEPAFVFLGKREKWEIGHIANVCTLHTSFSEPGLI